MTTEHLPYYAQGEVVPGFGRGSRELGIPTANFPEHVIRDLPSSFECGVYYGWAKLNSSPQVFKMTMCVGWNPYYHNTVKTMETHIIHKFEEDFYGDTMKIIVLGFMRPMCDFPSLDALIEAIHNDIKLASNHLETPESLQVKQDPFFLEFSSNNISQRASTENGTSTESNKSSSLVASNRSCENGHLSDKVNLNSQAAENERNAGVGVTSNEKKSEKKSLVKNNADTDVLPTSYVNGSRNPEPYAKTATSIYKSSFLNDDVPNGTLISQKDVMGGHTI